jgi:hypothetical protein
MQKWNWKEILHDWFYSTFRTVNWLDFTSKTEKGTFLMIGVEKRFQQGRGVMD